MRLLYLFAVVFSRGKAEFLATNVHDFELQEIVETDSRIRVNIDTHYVVATFTRTFSNENNVSMQIPFEVTIPETAFISGFQMSTNGRVFVGTVLTKESADEAFEEAVEQGDSAARVGRSDDDDSDHSNTYDVSLNVGPGSAVTFELSYDQLIARRLGWLELADLEFDSQLCKSQEDKNTTCTTSINPVPLDIKITEPEGIANVEVLHPLDPVPQIEISGTTAEVKMEMSESFVLTMRYETERNELSTFVVDPTRTCFVHLFSPPNLNPLLKAIVFVLDKSGSMSGSDYATVKQAAEVIIRSLRPQEYFSIVLFDDEITTLSTELLPATPENQDFFLSELLLTFANGGTDINQAILTGIDLLKNFKETNNSPFAYQIVFLTDGDATSGVTSSSDIRSNIRAANTEDFPIFSVGIGTLDFSLIREIALESGGFDRIIEDSENVFDGLTGLFEEINQVLLSDVEITYVSDVGPIDEVTDVRKTLFEGSELLISGKIPDGADSVNVIATGSNERGDVINFGGEFVLDDLIEEYNELRETGSRGRRLPDFEVCRVWALLTLRDLQNEIDILELEAEEEVIDALIEEATNLALEFQVVTDFTSIFVVQEDDLERCEGSDDFQTCIREDDRKGNTGQVSPRNKSGGKRFGKIVPVPGFMNGVCDSHRFCGGLSYCDDFGSCLPCIDCWIYHDGFGGLACPECEQCAPDASVREIRRSSSYYVVTYCNEGDSMSTVDIDLLVKSDDGFEFEAQVPVPEIGECDIIHIECELLGDTNCSEQITITAIAHFQSIWCEVPAANDELKVDFDGIQTSTTSASDNENDTVEIAPLSPDAPSARTSHRSTDSPSPFQRIGRN